jgi:hypothetical protein
MIAKKKRGKAGGKPVVVAWTNWGWRTIRRHPGAVANVGSGLKSIPWA